MAKYFTDWAHFIQIGWYAFKWSFCCWGSSLPHPNKKFFFTSHKIGTESFIWRFFPLRLFYRCTSFCSLKHFVTVIFERCFINTYIPTYKHETIKTTSNTKLKPLVRVSCREQNVNSAENHRVSIFLINSKKPAAAVSGLSVQSVCLHEVALLSDAH